MVVVGIVDEYVELIEFGFCSGNYCFVVGCFGDVGVCVGGCVVCGVNFFCYVLVVFVVDV